VKPDRSTKAAADRNRCSWLARIVAVLTRPASNEYCSLKARHNSSEWVARRSTQAARDNTPHYWNALHEEALLAISPGVKTFHASLSSIAP
jgi:hypothetical protein